MCVYQDTVQRYCAARSLKQARLAVVLTAALALPIWAAFLLLGTALWVLSLQPAGAALRAAGVEADSVVSTFALTYLPPGAGGIVLAGVLAAAMSSLDSSMNSVAGVVTTDWVQRLHLRGAPLSETRFLLLGRRASVAMAVLSVLGALALQRVPKEGMNDLYNGLLSVTGGASGGVMLLAVFTRCARDEPDARWFTPGIDGVAAVAAICGSVCVSLVAALCSFGALGSRCSLSYYWVLPLSNAAFAVCLVLCVVFRRCLHGTPVGGLGGASGGVGEGVTQTRLERDGIELIRKHSRARVEGSASVHVTAP